MFPPNAASVGMEAPDASAPQMEMELVNPDEAISLVNNFIDQKFEDRRPYEMQWYLNGLGVRTGADAKMHPILQRLETLTKEPSYRKRYKINRIRVKYLAKVAKYTNSRPRPQVMPASTDREDVLDARYSEYHLKYLFETLELEAKYEETVGWAEITGKAFWALRWDPTIVGRIKDPRSGQIVEAQMGDVAVDVTTAFEILVDDPGVQTLGRQKRIARVRVELVSDVEARHNLAPGTLEGDTSGDDLFQYQKQIADIGAQYASGSSVFVHRGRASRSQNVGDKKNEYILVKEYFEAPSGKHRKGRYIVVAGSKLLRYEEQLPYGFWTYRPNPFPFVEFASSMNPGQFWPTTMVEQLLSLQEQYSTFRSKLIEQLSLAMHPKLLVPRSAKIAENAYNSEPNEKIYYTNIPGMALPTWQPAPSVSMDAWRLFDTLRTEMDEVSNIYPSSLGGSSDAESGFQTNLLQEAADGIFAPDRRRMERALSEAMKKLRRICSIGYDVERLISIGSKGLLPAVFEFSNANIDDAAEVKVLIGSALPEGKAQRLKAVLELKASGLFGNGVGDPRANRGLLELAELDGIEHDVDPGYQDAENARLENLNAEKGQPLLPPAPWDGHPIHGQYHEETLKSPQFQTWRPEAKLELITHYTLHLKEYDPAKGLRVAQMFAQMDPTGRLMQLGQELLAIVQQMQQMQAAGPPPGSQPGGQGPAAALPNAA